MKRELEIRCIRDVPVKNIDIDSIDYLFEYLPEKQMNGDKDKKFLFLLPPLLLRDADMYKPVFGKSIIVNQIKTYGKIKMALSIDHYNDNYSLFKFLLFLKKNYLGLNPVEKSIFLYRFADNAGDNIYIDLEIPKNTKSIEGYRKLLNASDRIKDDLIAGKINEINLFEIFHLFDEKYWDILENFLVGLKIGTKKRTEIIDMLYDIIVRDNVSLETIINDPKIKEILKKRIDPPQKGEKIFDFIYEKRYPEITAYRKSFYERLKSLKLGKNIRFEIPPNFEKWEFSVSFNFKSLEEFKNRLSKLQLITENKDFEQILKMRF